MSATDTTPIASAGSVETRADTSKTQPDPSLPLRIDRYLVRREIGRGGMGVVLEAQDPALARTVAVKVLTSTGAANESEIRRFLQEARAASSLRHPSIVTVHDAGESDGRFYIAMDLIEGESLGQRLRRDGPLEPRRALELVLQVARALDHAHLQGIIHRDVKPDNILLDGKGQAFLGDFGLARNTRVDARLTQEGDFVGSPAYASPEHLRGTTLDGRADVYSLGATLYEALTCKRPFEALEPHLPRLFYRSLDELPAPPRQWRPELSPAIEAIVLKCVESRPDARYSTAGELALDIERFLKGERVLARTQGLRRTVQKIKRRWPLIVSGALLVVTGLSIWISRARSRDLARIDAQETRALAELVGNMTVEDRIARLSRDLENDPSFWEGFCELARLERRVASEKRRAGDSEGAKRAASAARAAILRAIETKPRGQLAPLLLFDAELCRVQLRDPSLARGAYETLAARAPGTGAAAYARARLAFEAGDRAGCRRELEAVFQLSSVLAPARLLEAQLALDEHDGASALAALDRIRDLGRIWDEAEPALLSGLALEQLGELAEARHRLDHAVEQDPHDSRASEARDRVRKELASKDR